MIDIATLTLSRAGAQLRDGTLSVRDLVAASRAAIAAKNPELNAFLEVFEDTEEDIVRAEGMLADGTATPLTGIPIAVKDNMLITGRISSSASKILATHRGVYDGTVIGKLKAAGAVILGRTNMDEFAMGGSGENSAYGPAKNPLDPSRVPGGSSSGSAVAVAGGMTVVSLGSDTGGSIRQPAALCGLVGLKPTYGAVSRYGLMAMASSLDQIGPFAKTVDDARVLYESIAGHDPMDSTTYPLSMRTLDRPTDGRPLRIGVPESFVYTDGVDPDVQEAFRAATRALEARGHTIVPVDLPLLPSALSVYYILMPAEVSANLARFDGIRYGLSADADSLFDVYAKSRGEGFGKEVRRRVLLGTYVLSAGYYDAYYGKALALKAAIMKDFDRVFADVDCVATPTSPTPAFKIGEKSADPLSMYLADIFTVSANIASIPALSVPCGTVSRDGVDLPVGFQCMGPKWSEATLFRVGEEIESSQKS